MNEKKWFEPSVNHLLLFFALLFIASFIGHWTFTNRLMEWSERTLGVSTFLFDWQFWIIIPLQPLTALTWLTLANGILLPISFLTIVPLVALLELLWQYWLAGKITANQKPWKQWSQVPLKKYVQPNKRHLLILFALLVVSQVLFGIHAIIALGSMGTVPAGALTTDWTFWAGAILGPIQVALTLIGVYNWFSFGITYSIIVAIVGTLDFAWLYLLAGWLSRLRK